MVTMLIPMPSETLVLAVNNWRWMRFHMSRLRPFVCFCVIACAQLAAGNNSGRSDIPDEKPSAAAFILLV